MNILVIHDFRRPQSELDECESHLKERGITSYGLLAATTSGYPSVQACINRSHREAVRFAKVEGWPKVCIMESDVWIPALDGWQYFLGHTPPSADLYLAGVYTKQGELRREFNNMRSSEEAAAMPIKNFAGMHCYIIDQGYYDTFLASDPSEHIDVAQDGRGQFYVCYPFAALQRPGWSANHRDQEKVSYNGELLSDDVYGFPI